MSILTELLHGNISPSEAMDKIAQWANDNGASPIVAEVEEQLKTLVATSIIPLSQHGLHSLIGSTLHTVEHAFDTLTSNAGLEAAAHDALEQVANTLKGAIDAKLVEAQNKLNGGS